MSSTLIRIILIGDLRQALSLAAAIAALQTALGEPLSWLERGANNAKVMSPNPILACVKRSALQLPLQHSKQPWVS